MELQAFSQIRGIVPPYLLQCIIDHDHNEDEVRESARVSIQFNEQYLAKREKRFGQLGKAGGARSHGDDAKTIIPDTILKNLSESDQVDQETRDSAKLDLEHVRRVRLRFQQQQKTSQKPLTDTDEAGKKKETKREVYDAHHDGNEYNLPGKLIIGDDKKSDDKAGRQAYRNVGHVLDFYKSIFKWNSIDDDYITVRSSVHFGRHYENAFWDPQVAQMVFGDGHKFIHNFTACVDVIGHELTHAVLEHTSPLNYHSQSGALNEHIADVFGIMVKQKVEEETAEKADWLIGEGCLLPDVKGVALRSMKAPGTAYDDPRFGKDPQPDNYSDFEPTSQDNGGVHLYSGIPNKAFYLASVAFGGYSWEKAGKIWWETLKDRNVPPNCKFNTFADLTVEKAEELYDEDAAKIVRKAWHEVGVKRKE